MYNLDSFRLISHKKKYLFTAKGTRYSTTTQTCSLISVINVKPTTMSTEKGIYFITVSGDKFAFFGMSFV